MKSETFVCPVSFFGTNVKKSFFCPLCSKRASFVGGSIDLDKTTLAVKYILLMFRCTDCSNGWAYSKANRSKIKDTLNSLYCGNHSGFRKCCILWHAFFYQHAIDNGNSLMRYLANKYFDVIKDARCGYVPCPYCLTHPERFVEVKSCKDSHKINFYANEDYLTIALPADENFNEQ